MHLESTGRQAFVITGNEVKFEKGETIHTENSYKYSIDEFSGMLKEAGFNDTTFWQDSGQRYAPLCGYDLINAVPSFWKFVSGILYTAFWEP